jgi:hypothetical protein
VLDVLFVYDGVPSIDGFFPKQRLKVTDFSIGEPIYSIFWWKSLRMANKERNYLIVQSIYPIR